MEYLSLKIDDQWAVLDEGTEIALEGNNPLFSDAGSKSYLFRLHVESNRHIFGTSDEIYGESYYKAIDGKRSTLYVMGIPVMTGKIALEDEVMMEDGYVAVNLVSGNLEFAQMIEGMNCREVELLDEIPIGYLCDKFTVTIKQNPDAVYEPDLDWRKDLSVDFPYNLIVVENSNVNAAYPQAKYCNIRRCYGVENSQDVSRYIEEYHIPDDFITSADGILSLEEASLNSGPCFYVLYFIDCLASKLGLSIERNDLLGIEDAKRLAFVNLSCKVKTGNIRTNRTPDLPSLMRNMSSSQTSASTNKRDLFLVEDAYYTTIDAYATSENFPDEQVANVISAISSLFNVKFVLDDGCRLSIVSIRDSIKSDFVAYVSTEIFDAYKIENNIQGFKLSYSSTDEDDTNYNFDRYDDIEVINQYGTALGNVPSFNKKVYIDSRTGNAYAIKVDREAEESGEEEELNPSLFEVGAFSPAIYGDCSDENRVDKVQLNFSPIITNDIKGKSNLEIAKAHPSSSSIDSLLENTYAFLIPEDIDAPNWLSIKSNEAVLEEIKEKHWYSGGESGGYYVGVPHDFPKFLVEIKYFNILGAISYSTESSVNTHETGLMFGIMRGPGSQSNVEYYAQNFDGEGNSRVAFTSANYAFTSDSVDDCNRVFDYNGANTDDSGVDQSGRFSLKLRARKYDKDGNPIKLYDGNGNEIIMDAARENRGLYDKFWKEYAYFTVNKKILRITCRMEIADIVAIDWTKRYRIGEHVGFIANYSYSVSTNGMSDVEMDLYYI